MGDRVVVVVVVVWSQTRARFNHNKILVNFCVYVLVGYVNITLVTNQVDWRVGACLLALHKWTQPASALERASLASKHKRSPQSGVVGYSSNVVSHSPACLPSSSTWLVWPFLCAAAANVVVLLQPLGSSHSVDALDEADGAAY